MYSCACQYIDSKFKREQDTHGQLHQQRHIAALPGTTRLPWYPVQAQAMPYLSRTETRVHVLLGSLLALFQGGPKEPHSLLFDRSNSCALTTKLDQLSGMLPFRALLPSDRNRSTVPL